LEVGACQPPWRRAPRHAVAPCWREQVPASLHEGRDASNDRAWRLSERRSATSTLIESTRRSGPRPTGPPFEAVAVVSVVRLVSIGRYEVTAVTGRKPRSRLPSSSVS